MFIISRWLRRKFSVEAWEMSFGKQGVWVCIHGGSPRFRTWLRGIVGDQGPVKCGLVFIACFALGTQGHEQSQS